MDFHLRLPGSSFDNDVDIARKCAEIVLAKHYGATASPPVPAHEQNQCERDGCTYLGTIVDQTGQPWLVYDCEGVAHFYKP